MQQRLPPLTTQNRQLFVNLPRIPNIILITKKDIITLSVSHGILKVALAQT